jgi:hypothetical protein
VQLTFDNHSFECAIWVARVVHPACNS